MAPFHVRPEERALIKGHNFSFRPLSQAGHQTVCTGIKFSIHPMITFCFSLGLLICQARLKSGVTVDSIYEIGVIALLIVPTISLGVFIAGVCSTACTSRIKWKAVLYWGWWPAWNFTLCILAAVAASFIGNYLWYSKFEPYFQLHRLQDYQGIDPDVVSGDRLQDSGLVTFANTAGVDRVKGGCLMNGVTYCIAPILKGGEVTNVSSTVGTHDLFMAGVDCCTCSLSAMTDFRCGEWNQPGQLGGMRNTDKTRREFFRLASMGWVSQYGKASNHPIFYEWVQDPEQSRREMYVSGTQLGALAFSAAVVFFILVVHVINIFLKVLIEYDFAGPNNAPVPPSGLGNNLARGFLPNMHKHYKEQQANLGIGDTKYVIL